MKRGTIFLVLASLLIIALVSVIANAQAECTGGVAHATCSPTKPKYCINGNLTDDCEKCGCPSTKQCNAATNTCVSFSEGWICKELTIRGLQKSDGTFGILENCPAGCYNGTCNPDPCIGIACKDTCFSNTTLNTKGICEGGICIYKKYKCQQGCYPLDNGTGICTENLTITETPEPIINGTATLPSEEVGENRTGINQTAESNITETETMKEPEEKESFLQKILGFFSFLKFWG